MRIVSIDSATQKPVACRIHLRDGDRKPVLPKHLPFWKDHFVAPGIVELDLPVGNYNYELDRGPEYLLTNGTFSVAANSTVTNELRRLANLANEGWWSGDLHVHRNPADIELLMQAEDLHLAQVITWWNTQNLWSKQNVPTNSLVRFDQNRFYHTMAGEDERQGGALLYFNLTEPLKIAGAKREYPSPMKFLREAKKHASVWVDVEKPFWWDAPIWFASGLVNSVGIANNHMQRGGMLENEAWAKARDRERLPGPRGNGFWTQEIYYHLLNCGLRLPPSAGSASGVLPNPVGYDRVYVAVDGPLTYDKWWSAFREGNVFVSNGPLLRVRANGHLPGYVFRAAARQEIELQAILDSRDPVSEIEIVKNGRIERTVPAASKRAGSIGRIEFDESGWFLVRSIANVPYTFRFASSGPFYVEVGNKPRRVSRASAQFFLDWIQERIKQLKIDDPEQKAEVVKYHSEARTFWEAKLATATAD